MSHLGGQVRPTLTNRIESLDVLRGVAILGILLANILSFGYVSDAFKPWTPYIQSHTEAIVESVRVMFVSGKFRGILAILFGVGLYLQFTKRKSIPGAWPSTYVRRTAILLMIGFFHAVFIWQGDILFIYGATALFAVLFVNLKDHVLLWSAVALISTAFLCGGSIDAIMALDPKAGNDMTSLPFVGPEDEIFAAGSYLEQLQFRFVYWIMTAVSLPFYIPGVLGLMLIGIWLGRNGVLAEPDRRAETLRSMSLIGLAGLILNSLPVIAASTGSVFEPNYIVDFGLSAPLAVGYIALITWLTTKKWLRPLNWMLGRIGRFALSNYLLQSVICTSFFYSWGGGYFEKLAFFEVLLVVPAVWLANVFFTLVWGLKFKMGPVEWLWRRISTGQPLAITHAAISEAKPVPPPRML
ncbi:DUF418 domain-containing protein [Kamptonema cortianum]|nr:DUF418 domain-containing protein [Geitlerinema splendidum]MDK3158699.1 DUF418 domain-containing protein [Kamptonema cortianum]